MWVDGRLAAVVLLEEGSWPLVMPAVKQMVFKFSNTVRLEQKMRICTQRLTDRWRGRRGSQPLRKQRVKKR